VRADAKRAPKMGEEYDDDVLFIDQPKEVSQSKRRPSTLRSPRRAFAVEVHACVCVRVCVRVFVCVCVCLIWLFLCVGVCMCVYMTSLL
jgi:hypothetical protein